MGQSTHGLLCILMAWPQGYTSLASLYKGSLRRPLTRSHVVWSRFVNLSELFSGMRSPWKEDLLCDFPTGVEASVLSVLSIQLSSFLLDEILQLLCPAQEVHQSFHTLNYIT